MSSRSRFVEFPLASWPSRRRRQAPRRGDSARTLALLASCLFCLSGCNDLLGLEPRLREAPVIATEADTQSGDASTTEGHANATTENDTAVTAGCTATECEAGSSLCASGAIQTCERVERGCLAWSTPEACPTGECANETTCQEPEGIVDGGSPPTPSPCVGSGCSISVGGACETDAQCVKAKCRDVGEGSRVCSTMNCEAACLDYAASGRACVDAEDDSKCGEVQCPASTPCRKYSTNVATASRCVDGRCGSPEEVCRFTARGEGAACDDGLLCDDAGNCNVPKLRQGVACQTSEQCSTEHCVDGVCCEQDCDALGVCMDCRPGTGTCDLVPEDDEKCEDVICEPRWTACVTEATDIITAHCARAGACKTYLDCPFEYAPKGTPCSGDHLCDAKGECGPPVVTCGAETCGGFGELGCCFSTDNPELTELTPACTLQSECMAYTTGWHIGCDEHSDCDITADQLCCATAFNLSGYTRCTNRSECNFQAPPPSPAISVVELCESPAMGARPCSNGAACSVSVEYNRVPGFTFCRLLD